MPAADPRVQGQGKEKPMSPVHVGLPVFLSWWAFFICEAAWGSTTTGYISSALVFVVTGARAKVKNRQILRKLDKPTNQLHPNL
jgi:hypothetical protein